MRKTIKQLEAQIEAQQNLISKYREGEYSIERTIRELREKVERLQNQVDNIREENTTLIKRESLTREILSGEASIKSKVEVLSDLTGVNKYKNVRCNF